jgi:hypothetical protein
MTTQIAAHQIHCDDEIAVTLTLDIEASGRPGDWTITSGLLTEIAVWLTDQAEEPSSVCVDRTAWLAKFLTAHAGDLQAIEEALDEQYDSDHEDDAVYASASWREAVALGVD